ncbi:MAG: dihydrodipicolinate synthase family protein [Hyphomicrobiaceae bacterium]|nr:dihydrodipicolinate synthase family protein [Hyphomicrobiaceae bacterium]
MTRLLDATARGVFPISLTPFHDDGTIDHASMDRLVDYFLSLGVPGLTLLGIMGEANKLTAEESLAFIQRAIRRIDGRAKVIVGTAHVSYAQFKSFSAAAMDAGASAVMVAPATGLRTEEHVHAFFDGLVSSIGDDVPIALQDYPQSSGVFLSVETLGRLFQAFPSIQMLKHEEGSAMRKITRLRAAEKRGAHRRVAIMVGNSGIHLPQELVRGVDGANTGVAFPEMLIEVCNRTFAGQAEAGEDLYDIFLPIVRHEWQPGIGLAIRKEIFRRRGLVASARARAPGPSLDADDHAELTRLLQRLHRRLDETGEGAIITSYPVSFADT